MSENIIGNECKGLFDMQFRAQFIPFELSSLQLTENGYTPEFEAEVLRTAEVDYAAIENGTAKPYNNTAEMFTEWDKEDDD